MKKIALLFLSTFMIFSCSNSDDEQDFQSCIEDLNITNEFIYRCDTFRTDSGRINMDNSPSAETTPCILEFINSEYADFAFEDGNDNINMINIRLSVPSEYYQLEALPEGTYVFRDDNDPNTLDITRLFRVGPDVSIYSDDDSESLLISGLVLGNTADFEQAELTVVRLNNGEYEIEYIFEVDGKIVRGHFRGNLSFVDNWT